MKLVHVLLFETTRRYNNSNQYLEVLLITKR